MSGKTRFPGKQDFLYRCFDEDGDLLYIGITVNPVARFFSGHIERSPWALSVRRIDIEPIPEGWAAVNWERERIVEEKPRHNVTYNQDEEWGRPKVHVYTDEECTLIAEAWNNAPIKNPEQRAQAVRDAGYPKFKVSTWYTLRRENRVK